MSNMMAEQLVRAALARFEADRQEAIAVIELYLNNPAGVAEHPSIVNEITTAIGNLADAEEAIGIWLELMNDAVGGDDTILAPAEDSKKKGKKSKSAKKGK